jgi:hypothetical protein
MRVDVTQMLETGIQLCARMHNVGALIKQRKADIL